MAPGAPDWIDALRGQFITFEGIDGCGKTTQAERLVSRLRGYGLPVLHTREPGGTPIGAALRRILLDKASQNIAPTCELLLFLADRIQHLDQLIRPALTRRETVICDRFHDATVAYQRFGRGLEFKIVDSLIASEISTTRPNLTIWLDLPVASAQKRIERRAQLEAGPEWNEGRAKKKSGQPTKTKGKEKTTDLAKRQLHFAHMANPEIRMDLELAAFHERVRHGYEELYRSESDRIVRVDATNRELSVAKEVWAALEERYRVP